MEDIDKIIISLPGQKQLEETESDHLTPEEISKVKNILTAIEDSEGIGMPYGTCKRVAAIYREIKEFIDEKENQ